MKISDRALRWINPVMTALLKSPLHGLVSRDIMLITFTGRRSGRSYTTPVSYFREGQTVRCFTRNDTAWWRNLRGGASVSLRVRGEEQEGHAEAISGDPKRIADALTAFLSQVPRDATYYDITLDANGAPDPEDLERAAHDVVLVETALHPSG
ncbi:MAG: nitroreductase/quinone reductase family protein [Myxococcota bacterium]